MTKFLYISYVEGAEGRPGCICNMNEDEELDIALAISASMAAEERPAKRARKEEVQKPTVVLECSICLDKLKNGAAVKALDCGHVFHKVCGDRWSKQKKGCAVCRR